VSHREPIANESVGYDARPDASPASAPEMPRESAPERDYSPPSEPGETSFERSAPSEPWSPPERSFEERPREDAESHARVERAEPAATESSGEPASVPADERQTG
jgi:hypothetical protein